MKWLDRLKNPKAPDPQAREPRQPTAEGGPDGFLGLQAYPPAPFQKIEASTAAANDATDTTPTTDPDRWCCPHSEAMSGQEIDTFTARLARFTDKGLTLADAEQHADRLVIRDRERDDRGLCLECAHLHGAGRWRCGNWHRAEVANQLKDTAYVSPMQYQSYDCDQLASESQRLQVRVNQIAGRLDEAASNDKAITGVGMILFWPALFALGGTKQQEAEYARLKGEYDAIQQAATLKKCPGLIPAAQTATPSASPASPAAPVAAPVAEPQKPACRVELKGNVPTEVCS